VTGLAEDEIEHTYRQYFQILRQKCARMMRDPTEAQDVAQETFVRLWSNRADIGDARAVTAWLYRTSTRLAVDSYRRNRTRAPFDDAHELIERRSDEPDRLHACRLLERIAGRVPTRELEVAILSRLDELTHDEIGEVTGMSGRSVRRLLSKFDSRLARFRERE